MVDWGLGSNSKLSVNFEFWFTAFPVRKPCPLRVVRLSFSFSGHLTLARKLLELEVRLKLRRRLENGPCEKMQRSTV